MKQKCLLLVPLVLLALAVGPGVARATDISEITVEDYYGAAYYEQALAHPQVSRQKTEHRRLRLVARDMRWKTKRLAQAVRKVRKLPGDPVELAQKAVKDGLAQSRVDGRVRDVLVNPEEPKHVVMYIRWQGSKGKNAIKEASEIAAVVAEKAPFVSTLSLVCTHPKAAKESKTPVWVAKIGRRAMARISVARIDDYADRMYKRLFEIDDERTRPF